MTSMVIQQQILYDTVTIFLYIDHFFCHCHNVFSFILISTDNCLLFDSV